MEAEHTSVNQRLAELLVGAGARRVFGLPASADFQLTQALIASGVQFTPAQHESGAVTMAAAFSRNAPDGFGVAVLEPGSGLTNGLTGISEAAKASSGMIVVATDEPRATQDHSFKLHHSDLVAGAGAVPARIEDPAQLGLVVSEILNDVARNKTVVLSAATDVLASPVQHVVDSEHPAPRTGNVPQTSQVVRAAKSLARAERPVILAGRGALGAKAELEHLAKTTGALLATSSASHGLFADNPWNLGMIGEYAAPAVAQLVSDADVLIAFGCSLDDHTTSNGALIGPATVLIQVDNSPWQIGKFREVSQMLVSDAASVASALDLVVPEHFDAGEFPAGEPLPITRTGYRTEEVAEKLTSRRWNDQPLPGGDVSTQDRIDPRVLSAELNTVLPTSRTLAVDSGEFVGYPLAYIDVPDEWGFVLTQAFHAVGLGLPTSVGAFLARPDRLPILGLDEAAMIRLAEIESLVRMRIPAAIIFYNRMDEDADGRPIGTDFAAVAAGYGARTVTVRSVEDLDQVAAWWDEIEQVPLEADSTDDSTEVRLSGTPLFIDARIVDTPNM